MGESDSRGRAQKKMPPWFADTGERHTQQSFAFQTEIETLTAWAESGAAAGDPKDAPSRLEFPDGWRIGKPDAIIEIPKTFQIPASGAVPYQYISVPTGFTEDKWVTAVEIRPSNRRVVHHVNASAVQACGSGDRGSSAR